MVTSTNKQDVQIKDSILTGFINGLSQAEDHNSLEYDTTTKNLAINIIDSLGGEQQFLGVCDKVVQKGLRRTKTLFTSDHAVRLYSEHQMDVIYATHAIVISKGEDYLLSRVMDRISHLKGGELAQLFSEQPDDDGSVSANRKALNQLMADICVEDFCENYTNYRDDIMFGSQHSVQ